MTQAGIGPGLEIVSIVPYRRTLNALHRQAEAIAPTCKFTRAEVAAYVFCRMRSHSFLFQQDLYADVDVVISVAPSAYDDKRPGVSSTAAHSGCSRGTDTGAVKRFPAHMAILSQSDYFHAQAQFVANTHGQASSRPPLTLTLQDASHVPAVEAIVSLLYGVEGAIQRLQQHQLVHVVQYADIMMLQQESVVEDAVDQLSEAAGSAMGLTEQTLDALGSMVWPSCLLQLLPAIAGYARGSDRPSPNPAVQQILVASLGNLEEVWSDQQLCSRLLQLPLPAMQLLLSSDQLSVYNEDTVLFTVYIYMALHHGGTREKVGKALSPLVRVPLLSDFQLTAQALNSGAQHSLSTSRWCGTYKSIVLQHHQEELSGLLSLRRFEPLRPDMVKEKLPSAPESWQLPARQILPKPVDGVQLVWQVHVDYIKAAYQESSDTQGSTTVVPSECMPTPPLFGMAWNLQMECRWNTDAGGVMIGVYSTAWCYPQDVYYKQVYNLQGPGVDIGKVTSPPVKNGERCGDPDFFGLGALRGDWGQSAWVSKGLPIEGHIELKLSVYDVI